MKERPILFNGAMVRAILNGRKTQTRRVIKPEWSRCLDLNDMDDREQARIRAPLGRTGDQLWVRETWAAVHVSRDFETGVPDDVVGSPHIPEAEDDDVVEGYWRPVYAASDPCASDSVEDRGFRWRPSIHMPRWASRINLALVDVRTERLKAISWTDARAEGISCSSHDFPGGFCTGACGALSHAWIDLWDSVAKPEHSWDANPWVWVYEFKRVEAAA